MTKNSNGAAAPANHRQVLGQRGEDAVVSQIVSWGWQVVARNWRCKFGELDIVARDGDTLIFIEVKTRSSAVFGHPAEAVDASKLMRLRRLVGQWLHEHPHQRAGAIRLDVAALIAHGDRFECDYIAGVGS